MTEYLISIETDFSRIFAISLTIIMYLIFDVRYILQTPYDEICNINLWSKKTATIEI